MKIKFRQRKRGELLTPCPHFPQTNVEVGSWMCTMCDYHQVMQTNPSGMSGFVICIKGKEDRI